MLNIFCAINWDILSKFATALATIVAVIVAYKLTQRNMRFETQERLGRFRNEKIYEAGMGFWALLAYTTDAENANMILIWEKEEKTNDKKYFIHVANARAFIIKLNEMNYEKGHGLFLRTEARELFYEYRSILHGFLLSEKNNTESLILIKKKEMAAKMIQLHQEMIKRLNVEMNLGERKL
jgi:hypothetical protein